MGTNTTDDNSKLKTTSRPKESKKKAFPRNGLSLCDHTKKAGTTKGTLPPLETESKNGAINSFSIVEIEIEAFKLD